MRRSKKVLSLVLAAMLVLTLALGAVGCGQQPAQPAADANKTAEQTTTQAAAPAPAQPVELNFWEQDDPKTVDPVFDEIIKAFQDANPTITVKRTHYETEALRSNFQNAVLANEGPQIISGPDDNIGVFGTAQTILPLDNFVKPELLSSLDKKALDGEKMGGKLYGIPYRIGNCLALLYNKKLVANPPKTMDELVTMAKGLTKDGNYGFAYNLTEPFFFVPYLGAYNGRVFDENGKITLNTDAMKKALQLAYDFKFTSKVVPPDANYDVASNLFKEGKAAMIINGPWSYKEYKDAGIDLGITKIPEVTGGTFPAPYTGTKVLMVSAIVKDDATKDAVNKFIEFLNNKENQLKLAKVVNEFPTNLEAAKDPYVTGNEEMKNLSEQMAVGTPMPIIPEMRAVWDGMRPSLEAVMAGKATPDAAAAEMQKKAEEIAKTMLGEAK